MTARTDTRFRCLLPAVLAATTCIALPLENWRLPFYRIASDFERSDGSPSRMFWDGIGTADLFDSTIWLTVPRDAGNFWVLEPSAGGGGTYPRPPHHETSFFYHGDAFNWIRFRRLTAVQSLDVDKRYEYDPYYPAHSERGVRGLIEEAYLRADWKHGFVTVGRKKRSWGPWPDRSLVLSSNPYSYDAVEWQVWGGIFEFRHLFAPFSMMYASRDSDNGSSRERYLTAHSLNVMFGKWVTIGITETVLFSRRGGFPDLQYINPVSIYTVINTNQEGGNGNLMLGFQWNIHPGTDKVSIRGQLLLDDFQVDNEKATDQEPAHWGLDAGMYWRDPFPKIGFRHLLKLEYTRASEWLYTVPDNNADNAERYIYGRKSLGLPYNDGYCVKLSMLAVPERYGACGISFSYGQRGGNGPMSRWNDSEHVRGLPYDTGLPQQRRLAAGAEGVFYFRDYAHLYLCGDLGWTRNKENVKTASFSFDPSVTVEAAVHFSDFFRRLP